MRARGGVRPGVCHRAVGHSCQCRHTPPAWRAEEWPRRRCGGQGTLAGRWGHEDRWACGTDYRARVGYAYATFWEGDTPTEDDMRGPIALSLTGGPGMRG
jgi:hypothetical protein